MSHPDRDQADEDKPLESQLRDALRPLAPDDAFTQALLATLAERSREPQREAAAQPAAERRRERRARGFPQWWLAVGMAASLLVAVGAVQHRGTLRERQQGLEARREVIEALRVTTQKLDLAYQAVRTQTTPPAAGNPGV